MTYSIKYVYGFPIDLEENLAVDINADRHVFRKIGLALASKLCPACSSQAD
jgi:hypothetical protein